VGLVLLYSNFSFPLCSYPWPLSFPALQSICSYKENLLTGFGTTLRWPAFFRSIVSRYFMDNWNRSVIRRHHKFRWSILSSEL
jgi:hypothetical protein